MKEEIAGEVLRAAEAGALAIEEARARRGLLNILEDLREERRLADTARRQWMETVDALRDPLMVHDAEYRILRCNRAYAQRAGMEIAQVLGKRYWECFPRGDGPARGCRRAVEGGLGDSEEEIGLDTGETFHLRCFAASGGESASWLSVFEDITERKRAAATREASRAREFAQSEALARIAASQALAAGDIESFAAEVTEAAARAIGVERANVWLFNENGTELRCIDLYEAGAQRHSSGMVLAEAQYRNEFQALKQSRYVDASDPLTDPRTAGYVEGYLKPLRITSMLDAVVAFAGKHLGLLCLEHVDRPHAWKEDEISFACQVADKIALAIANRGRLQAVEELARREARFRALLQHASDLVIVVDKDGVVRYVSPSITALGGYAQEEVLGLPFLAFMHPDDVPAARHEFAQLVSTPGSAHAAEYRYRHRDGRWVILESFAKNAIDDPAVQGIVLNARDVTESRRMEQQTRVLARFPQENPHAVMRVGRDATVMYANPASVAVQAVCGAPVGQRMEPAYAALVGRALSSGEILGQEIESGGRYFSLTFAPIVDEGYVNVYGIDVTERRREEQVRKLSEQRLALATKSAGIGIWDWDIAQDRLVWDARMYELYGIREKDFSGAYEAWQSGLHPDDVDSGNAAVADALAGRKEFNHEFRVRWPNGDIRHIEGRAAVLRAPDGSAVRMIGVNRDITERRQAAQALEFSERRFRSLIEGSDDVIYLLDAQGNVKYRSPSATRLLGRGDAEVVGTSILRDLHPDDAAPAHAAMAQVLREPGTPVRIETRVRRADGQWRDVEVVGVNQLDDPAVGGVILNLRDMTERKAAEVRIRRLNRVYAVLSGINNLIVRTRDRQELFEAACRIAVNDGQFISAAIALLDEGSQALHAVAQQGAFEGFSAQGMSVAADSPFGQTTAVRAVRERRPVWDDDLTANRDAGPNRARNIDAGARAMISLPIFLGDRVIGVLVLFAPERNFFDGEEIRLLSELAGDISHALHYLEQAARIDAYEKKMRAGMEATIGAIAAALESRDPYTAGHQRRVADLAAAIAREMGFTPDRVQGVHFGALIHDLGKIQVPAELLSKPTRLTKLEFELIKTHPQAGYDIIKGIEFPWPVAYMVLQHHERIDGSGYPQGLKGEEIALEARILAVADVVEAMASHRPYRPGLGIEKALQEIEDKRGTWFCPAVADACLRLFREKRFEFGR